MATGSLTAQSNRLVAALSAKDRAALVDASTPIEVSARQVLIEHGDRVRFVYFPLDCILSQLAAADEYSMMEAAMIGREGVACHSEAVGDRFSTSRVSVTRGGAALQLSVSSLLKIVDASTAVRDVIHRYIIAYISQLAQTIVCTRFHQIEPRLARWLLMADDRSPSDAFNMTQDELAILLGVRRVGISAAAAAFKSEKIISYSRGSLRLIDRPLLEAAACTCYPADRVRYDRNLSRRES